MIVAKEKHHQLTILNEDDPTYTFYKRCKEVNGQTTLDNNSIEDLDYTDREQVINKLMQLYRLNGYSNEHKENVFFTVKDIRKHYKNYKPT